MAIVLGIESSCDETAAALVTVMMAETGHAVGLKLGNGMEVLIHVGIDTVEMNGDGFEVHVRQGQLVHAGDPLVSFDRAKIAAAGKKDTVMEIVTEPGEAGELTLTESGSVRAGKTPVVKF